MALYMKKRRSKRLDQARNILGNKCNICGSMENIEFDHIIPETKSFLISSAKALDGPWSNLLEELKKCQLLCKECHIKKTQKENQGRIPWNKNEEPYVHGTMRMYDQTKCKCNDCKMAKRLYRNKQISFTEKVNPLRCGSHTSDC